MSRIAELLERLRGYGPLPCMEHDGQAFSYLELCEAHDAWAARLASMSIMQGDVVALRSDYSVSAVALLLALLSRRAIVALLPANGPVDELLADCRASCLFDVDVSGKYAFSARPGMQEHPLLQRLREQDDGGLVIFTSGSTGRAKAALHSAHGLLYKFRKPGRRFRTLAFLLFDHIAGMDTLFHTLSSGGALVITRRRDPHAISALIETAGVEVLPASPSFLRLLCMSDDAARDFSSLKIITYGSERMDETTLLRLNERFKHAQIIQKYGTTETGSPRSVSRANDSLWIKLRSEGVETRVIDGVLWIRSEGSILGYLNAELSAAQDGWYCTGDLVEQDGEWLRFVGRTADLINVGGEKVSPSEVEQVILSLDFVVHAAVSGEPHALLGHVVRARVDVVEGCEASDAVRRIRAHCRARLARYKVPMKIEVVPGGLLSKRQKLKRSLVGS